MTTFLLATAFVALFFVLMSVRLIFLKNGEFKGTCASQNPYLNKDGAACGYCGREIGEGEDCGKDEQSEVDKVIAKFS